MTKRKQFLRLFLILAALLFVYGGITLYNSWQQKDSASSGIRVVELDPEEIEEISYTDTVDTVTCRKDGGTWYEASDKNFPLKQSRAEDAVSSFTKITANRKLKEPEELESYGLDDPAYTVTMTDSQGSKTEIWIGSVASNSDYYLTADGGETIYTVSSLITEDLIFDESLLLQTETFPEIDSSNLISLKIEKNGKTLVNCEKESEEDEDENEDEDLISTYGSELSGITLDTCVEYNAGKRKLKQYGLDTEKRKTVTAVYTDSETEDDLSKETKSESDDTSTQVFYMGTVFEESNVDYVYMQLKGSKMIYKVFVSDTEKLIED